MFILFTAALLFPGKTSAPANATATTPITAATEENEDRLFLIEISIPLQQYGREIVYAHKNKKVPCREILSARH